MRSAQSIAGDLRGIADELDNAARHVPVTAAGASSRLADRANLLRELARDLEALERDRSADLIVM